MRVIGVTKQSPDALIYESSVRGRDHDQLQGCRCELDADHERKPTCVMPVAASVGSRYWSSGMISSSTFQSSYEPSGR